MRISDWSSDVCSSDLFLARCRNTLPAMEPRIAALRRHVLTHDDATLAPLAAALALQGFATGHVLPVPAEEEGERYRLDAMCSRESGNPDNRKSVGWGKSVSARVDLSGGRCIKK